ASLHIDLFSTTLRMAPMTSAFIDSPGASSLKCVRTAVLSLSTFPPAVFPGSCQRLCLLCASRHWRSTSGFTRIPDTVCGGIRQTRLRRHPVEKVGEVGQEDH